MTGTLDAFLAEHADIMRVRLIRVRGSSPREAGAEMLVARAAAYGTIGGGQLEYMAMDQARAMLTSGRRQSHMDVPLGPEIGQCCGGRVEISLTRMAASERRTACRLAKAERASRPQVLIFGAGHVGRALVTALAPLPVLSILIDSRAEELAKAVCADKRLTPLPEAEVRKAPSGAAYIVLTHDHSLDFQIAAEALARSDAAYIGMIGSATKRASFVNWTRSAHAGLATDPLVCPIGAAGEGDKRPEVIALHTAAEVMTALTRRLAGAGVEDVASLAT